MEIMEHFLEFKAMFRLKGPIPTRRKDCILMTFQITEEKAFSSVTLDTQHLQDSEGKWV